jgi:anthranilate phosphoribosyltransferase
MSAALEALHKAVENTDLTAEEASAAMNEILDGKLDPALIAALLTALRMKGETVDEIIGCARSMRQHAASVPLTALDRESLVDTCGTGGDDSGTFNISTATALVVAGAGVPVAKHGNRSISSRCGSADVLEALGVAVALSPEHVAQSIEEVGVGFMFAPRFHPAMKFAQPVRAQIKMRTIFNVLGPLTNPAGAGAQVVGVFAERLVPMIGEALAGLGVRRAFVVHGEDGLDEITTTGATTIANVRDGKVTLGKVSPGDFGLDQAQPEDLVGGDVETNTAIVREILDGKPGPSRDIVVANASAALVAAGRANDFRRGAKTAAESIDSGEAAKRLERLAEFTSHLAKE